MWKAFVRVPVHFVTSKSFLDHCSRNRFFFLNIPSNRFPAFSLFLSYLLDHNGRFMPDLHVKKNSSAYGCTRGVMVICRGSLICAPLKNLNCTSDRCIDIRGYQQLRRQTDRSVIRFFILFRNLTQMWTTSICSDMLLTALTNWIVDRYKSLRSVGSPTMSQLSTPRSWPFLLFPSVSHCHSNVTYSYSVLLPGIAVTSVWVFWSQIPPPKPHWSDRHRRETHIPLPFSHFQKAHIS